MDFAPYSLRSVRAFWAGMALLAWFIPGGQAWAHSDVTIKGGLNRAVKYSGKNPKVATPTKPVAVAALGPIRTHLNAGRSVTVTTASAQPGNGDLTVLVDVPKAGKKPATLRLQAERDLIIKRALRATRSALSVELSAGRKITLGAPITTNGGNVSIQTVEPFELGAALNVGAGQIIVQGGSVESANAQTLTTTLVNVSEQGALRMRGNISGVLSVAGTISPGINGASELQVGSLALQPSARTVIGLGSTASFGKIVSKGVVTLSGQLQVDCVNGFEDLIIPTQSFTIISGTSITGTFDGIPNEGRVFLPDELGSLKVTYSATSVVLSDWQPIITDLTWDPGTEDDGTNVFTNTRTRGRRHYFRVHPEITDIGAWRTRLTPAQEGEADIYMRRGGLPSTTSSDYKSNRVGEDGFVLNKDQFDAAQEWLILVYADPGRAWSVFSGRAYVQDLGMMPWQDMDSSGTYQIGEPVLSSGSGPVTIRGEGMRFFKATLPSGTPAWSLWLNGSTQNLAVRRSVVPFHNTPQQYDRKGNGQLLIVPPVLISGVSSYFASVLGNPGDVVNLDSRIQEVVDMPFDSTDSNVSVPDAPYRVYRVNVPPEQIAWDISTIAVDGDPNIAIRRGLVAAEKDNEAFSEVAGQVRDSITVVPNFLTDGAWYITVYGESAYTFTLRNGPPVITPINFTDSKTNDQPERVGWRYFALTDIEVQLGAHGWMLELANQVPGTEIALRRNAVPSRWRQRKDGQDKIIDGSVVEYSGSNGFLERPAHQPDVWYAGVYMPTQPLGGFTLFSRPIEPPVIAFDGGTRVFQDVAPGRWSFVHVNVPAGVEGWDVRVRNVTGAVPLMAVRHDLLPEIFPPAPLSNIPAGWNASRATAWPTGNQWRGILDWTGYAQEADGRGAGPGLVVPMGRPLQPGSYYIGVLNASATEASTFTVESRGIGAGQSCPITPLAYDGGTAAIADLAPRDARYFKVTIPPGAPSWELLVDATVGDFLMAVRRSVVPDFTANLPHSVYEEPDAYQTEMKKIGHERYVLLPAGGAEFLDPGDYYIAVVSEGVNPTATAAGAGAASGTIRSMGPLGIKALGTASPSGINEPVSLVAGQFKAYHFTVAPDTDSLEIRLLDPVGAPVMTVIPGPLIPHPELPTPKTVYGIDGGPESTSSTGLITAANLFIGTWTVLVHAPASGDASATLNIVSHGPVPLAFDGGLTNVTGHAHGTWRYFRVEVPANAVGWDIRLRNLVGGNASLMLRRDFLPNLVDNQPNFIPLGWRPHTVLQWPSGNQWMATVDDWTGYSSNPGNVQVPDRVVAGMGMPLEPGIYFAGVYNRSGTEISYTIDSRGVGVGMMYPLTDLAYVGGTASVTGLAPREARYFRVNIPPNSSSWEVTLTPTAGEMELLARYQTIPDFMAIQDGSIHLADQGREVEMKKAGAERYVLLPAKDQQFLPAGDYYLAVVSEGMNPQGGVIGTETSSGQLTSVGPLAIKDLGIPSPDGTREQVNLAAGQIRAYQVTVPPNTQSLEVRLDQPVGNPQISLVEGTQLPWPAAFGANIKYGWNAGEYGVTHNSIITAANPSPGVWSILVRGGDTSATPTFDSSTAELVVTALTHVPLDFDGGSRTVTNQQPASWRYFSVEVPADAEGWDIRLRNVVGAVPSLLVRRDGIPFVAPSSSPKNEPAWTPTTSSNWPSGHQYLGTVDWTGYLNKVGDPGGPPGIVAPMGRPLEPGTYFIGVFNNRATPTSYTIGSRGIGAGRTYEVTELAFAGGTATFSSLDAREPKYFKVTIPADTPSWELSVAPTVGDLQLAVRRNHVPDFFAPNAGTIYSATAPQLKIRKEGAERYVLLSDNAGDLIPAGDYYIAVVSDGANPNRVTNVVGTGVSGGSITSHGVLPIPSLGTVTVDGVVENVELVSTQSKGYQFEVPEGAECLEVRLENTIGYAKFTLASGTRLAAVPPLNQYGGANGGASGTPAARIQTVINPKPGPWRVALRATDAPPAEPNLYPDATTTLVVRQKPSIPLNFDAALNGNGLSNIDERHAIDGEHQIYKVTPPATIDGQPVLGWVIRTDLIQGTATVRVFKDLANPTTSGIEKPAGTMIVVPPFLTFDQPWYVMVKATGTTHYRITLKALTLERPVWTMPEDFNQTFGDSGIDAGGNPLPGDRGIDLEQGSWNFFAIDVPANNRGLLRTELQAISGNPDLYIREDGVPTTDHNASGSGGLPLIHRSMTGVNTTYGNWVPISGRTETRLKPGRWFIGVRAGGSSNVRYRLIVSSGNVREMALDPSTATAQIPSEVTGQVLADNDWRYYRFTVPENAPTGWTLTFGQTVGDVVMRIRDTVPPGQRKLNTATLLEIADAYSDAKNQGPYEPGYDLPGEYALTTPPLRPGHVYYVGFRSNNSATFTFGSRTSGAAIVQPPPLDFYTGSVNTTIPAHGSVTYRIAVPPEATRFKYTSIHNAAVKVRIEQGTLTTVNESQHFVSTIANSTINVAVSLDTWPWQPGQTYHVRFVNTSPDPQNIEFMLNGKNAQTEDEDNDGLLDAWERQWFANLGQSAAGDPDGDGVANAIEFADGTEPNNAASAKYALTVLAKNGTAAVNPVQAKYDKGTLVSLSSTADAGYQFVGWVGGPLRKDDWVIKATGTISVPAGGTWTFGVHSGDGVRLLVNGGSVLTDGATHEPRAAFGQINLTAGEHTVELVAFERIGGESLELFVAPGSFTAINPDFRLIGDTANGGLAVTSVVDGTATPGFLVRQVALLSATVSTLAAADSILNAPGPNRIEITGTIDSINFLDHSAHEGFFTNNAHFPLTAGMEDQPMELAINSAYTMTALHSLPLEIGTDADNVQWDTGGSAPWLAENDPAASNDGVDVAGSGPVDDNQNSILQATIQGPGTLAFRWRVSSQQGDSLVLALNGGTQTSITGEVGWAQRTLNIPAGTHRVTWTYSKNGVGSAGADRGFVDEVTFTPQ